MTYLSLNKYFFTFEGVFRKYMDGSSNWRGFTLWKLFFL